jgi:DNA repair exonuclease SbcCD ATPase subunit
MINRITYSVVFPTTGATLKGEFKPQPGITAVIGPNESGKTFTTIELVRYLLFGKKALRGPASDYIKLNVEGEFTIRGHSYTFSRSSKKEQVTDAIGTVIAVGAEEVTNKAVELLGYGLNVFDIANASVQKQADLFGQLRPAERKRLIDEVVGLADQEKVEKALRDEGNTLQREAEALLRGHVKPVKPDKPKGYVSSDALQKDYDEAYSVWTKAQSIAQRLVVPTMPQRPQIKDASDDYVSKLINELNDFNSSEQERLRLEAIVSNATPVKYTREELEAALEVLAWKDIASNQMACPKCGHEFVPGHEHAVAPSGPDLTKEEIRRYSAALNDAEAVATAQRKLSSWPKKRNPAGGLAMAQQANREWHIFRSMEEQFKEQTAANAVAKAELLELGDVVSNSELEYMREAISNAKVYERDLVYYNENLSVYNERNDDIVNLQKRAADFKQGAKDLAAARGSIKSYLAPAISAASSNLMHQMTNGKHSVITVDEDMNVTVGSQSLDTLSGGAATVANLALRLALGQVLVAETFPVFIGDEMDSDADGDRRETVAEALQNLITNMLLKQIILITHRSVDIADHVHDLSPSDTSE